MTDKAEVVALEGQKGIKLPFEDACECLGYALAQENPEGVAYSLWVQVAADIGKLMVQLEEANEAIENMEQALGDIHSVTESIFGEEDKDSPKAVTGPVKKG